jgi:methionine sulfoxide reductase catalytic subunit
MTRFRTLNIRSSDLTPESVYLSRRKFMQAAGLAVGAALVSACAPAAIEPTPAPLATRASAPVARAPGLLPVWDAEPKAAKGEDELGDPLTSHDAVTTYNNFYEFGMDKDDPARNSKGFVTSPWTVQVGGLVNQPKTFGVEDLIQAYAPEERVYRMRCVEAWSMVIPWLGFPLHRLLKAVDPQGSARYVRFETLHDPEQMPGQKSKWYTWPYIEGLRLDEAMHDLTLVSVGLYGKALYPQNGAPLRLVVPWKYGFKSIKSIVKIDLVEEQPTSLWMSAAPNEYGFFSNVNPDVPHPRWSQSTERRIGEGGRRETLPFNGYADQVAGLYAGMDLQKYY